MHWTPSKKLESFGETHLLASKETSVAGLHLSCQTDNSMLYLMALHHRQSLFVPEPPGEYLWSCTFSDIHR